MIHVAAGQIERTGVDAVLLPADAIREAEAPLLASLPDGALMRRAAYGLANAIARELVLRTGGVAGRSVCAVVGSGRQRR